MVWYIGGNFSWKHKKFEWQVCNLWGYHCRYFWVVRWQRADGEGHRRVIGTRGYK